MTQTETCTAENRIKAILADQKKDKSMISGISQCK